MPDNGNQEETPSKEVNVTIANTNYVYDGTEKRPTVQIKYEDIILKENIDYTLEYLDNKNAGTATIEITYNSPYYGDETLHFEIAPRPLTITIKDYEIFYGDPLPEFEYTLTGLVEGDEVIV